MATRAHRPRGSLSPVQQGGIAAAVITTVGGIIVAALNNYTPHIKPVTSPVPSSAMASPSGATASKESTWTTITPPPLGQGSDQGPVDKYAVNDSGTEVKVWGHAEKDTDGMIVLIGPQPSGGFWPAFANVVNYQWQADIATAPQISEGYKIWAIPHTPSGHASSHPVKFTFQGTDPSSTTPSPPPDLNCAVQHGPDCFKGPGWGPPTVYQPNQ
jgi:hypothetical protein